MKHLAYGAAFVGALALTAAGWLAIPASADDPSAAPVANSPPPAQPATPATPSVADVPGCPPVNQRVATHHYRSRVHHGSQYTSVHSYSSYVEVPVPVPVPVYAAPPPPPPPPAPGPVLYAGIPGPRPWFFHGGWRGRWGRRWW
jgi:hypothetical protein